MTDFRINLNQSYGGSPLYAKNNNNLKQQENQKDVAVNQQREDVDPNKVMEFMESLAKNNNYSVAPAQANAAEEVQVGNVQLDAETQNRIGGYMANFELIYGSVVAEFGSDNAPFIMDLFMNKFPNMVA